ncbi:MAG: ABC transporter permease [Deltaproteobacteria bacterium]|nr:ABC transporter permease [Deltaproteobacteria bacterium]
MSPAGTDRPASLLLSAVRLVAPYFLGALLVLAVWFWTSLSVPPMIFPTPAMVGEAAVRIVAEGTLPYHIAVSLGRILAGFAIGCLLGIPLGLLMGSYEPVRYALEPYTEFFRFIPGIAMSVLAIVWFGVGETSKVFLTFFSTVFTVIINADAAVRGVERNRLRAALSLGATSSQVFFHVVLPSCMPMILTGMRIGMGFAFATIISAELLAAEAGIGFMISSARLFMQTDRMFVAIVTLGLLGFVIDLLFRALTRRFAGAYARPE